MAGAFLPCYGPLADSAEYVRNERVILGTGRLQVDDDDTLKLFNVTVLVELSSEQVSEEALSSALLAFRRAANILGQKKTKSFSMTMTPSSHCSALVSSQKRMFRSQKRL